MIKAVVILCTTHIKMNYKKYIQISDLVDLNNVPLDRCTFDWWYK